MITLTPDSLRTLLYPVRYLGEAPLGQVANLPYGAVLNQSGLPLLIPVPAPAVTPEPNQQ